MRHQMCTYRRRQGSDAAKGISWPGAWRDARRTRSQKATVAGAPRVQRSRLNNGRGSKPADRGCVQVIDRVASRSSKTHPSKSSFPLASTGEVASPCLLTSRRKVSVNIPFHPYRSKVIISVHPWAGSSARKERTCFAKVSRRMFTSPRATSLPATKLSSVSLLSCSELLSSSFSRPSYHESQRESRGSTRAIGACPPSRQLQPTVITSRENPNRILLMQRSMQQNRMTSRSHMFQQPQCHFSKKGLVILSSRAIASRVPRHSRYKTKCASH